MNLPKPFRIWLRIRRDIRNQKSTPRCRRCGESSTLRIGDARSRQLPASPMRGVDDSPHRRSAESPKKFSSENSADRRCGESTTPRIADPPSRDFLSIPIYNKHYIRLEFFSRLRASPIRRVVDSAHRRCAESTEEF